MGKIQWFGLDPFSFYLAWDFFWKQKCKCWLLCMTLDNVKSGETVPFPWVLWIFHIVSPINTEQSQEQTYILIGL